MLKGTASPRQKNVEVKQFAKKNMIRREKKWRREEDEGFCSNFKHDEVVVLNSDILINGKVVVEDIVGEEKEMREMKEIEEGRRRRGDS